MTETSTVQPAGIPYEHRQAASLELIEVANRMMQGAQSLLRKSARVMDPDPKKLGRLIGALRRYGDSQMPCTDEMPRIEALLRGVPEDQCLSEHEKRRLEREEREHQRGQARNRRYKEEAELRNRVRQALDELNGPAGLSAAEKARLKQLLDAFTRNKPLPAPVVHVEGNVISGPWDTAS